jgi:hypothetical protein
VSKIWFQSVITELKQRWPCSNGRSWPTGARTWPPRGACCLGWVRRGQARYEGRYASLLALVLTHSRSLVLCPPPPQQQPSTKRRRELCLPRTPPPHHHCSLDQPTAPPSSPLPCRPTSYVDRSKLRANRPFPSSPAP